MADLISFFCPNGLTMNRQREHKDNFSMNQRQFYGHREKEKNKSRSSSEITASAESKRSKFASKRFPLSADSSSSHRSSTNELVHQLSMGELLQNNCQVLSNKVAPVVIRNCKEEFQIRSRSTIKMGKLYEHLTEHDLLMDKYFLLKDHFVGIDRHGSLGEVGVPNLHKCTIGTPAVFAIGQPTLNGVKKFIESLASEYSNILYVNIRAVPTLFLKRSGDFLPYSAYNTSIEADNIFVSEQDLNDSEREMQTQALEIAHRNDGHLFFYNALDSSADEPHMYKIKDVRDLVTSRQLNASIQSEIPNFRYKRLPLHDIHPPSPTWVDSLLQVLKESGVILNRKSAVVFQGLSGEGPARIAMILTSILLQARDEIIADEKQKRKINLIENSARWRSFVLKELLKDDRLYFHKTLDHVNAVISRSFTEVALLKLTNRIAKSRKIHNTIDWVLRETANKKGLVEIESLTDSSGEFTSAEKSGVVSSLSLRDISELSLRHQHNRVTRNMASSFTSLAQHSKSIDGSLASHDIQSECISTVTTSVKANEANTHYRYEVFDEESLIEKICMYPDMYLFFVIFAECIHRQTSSAMQYSFTKWLTLNSKYLMHFAQTMQYNQTAQPHESPCYLKAINSKSRQLIGNNRFLQRHHRVTGFPIYGIGHMLPTEFAEAVKYVCRTGAKKKIDNVVFVNLKNEIILYTDSISRKDENDKNAINSVSNSEGGAVQNVEAVWEVTNDDFPCMFGANMELLEDIEEKLCKCVNINPDQTCLLNYFKSPSQKHNQFQTTRYIVENLLNSHEDLQTICKSISYLRLPMPKYRIPLLEQFDNVVRLIREGHSKDPATAFVFYCHNGKRRTANMMAAACLVLGHVTEFPSYIKDILDQPSKQWIPDEEYERGEFKVVLDILQIIPDSYMHKREVDAVLDMCYENMSTMHYHLRENLNPSHKKANRAQHIDDKMKYIQRSVQSLEYYIYLILFNCYLAKHKSNFWREMTFETWMKEYANRLGVMDILNNMGFDDAEKDKPFWEVLWRWMPENAIQNHVVQPARNTAISISRK